MKAMVPVVDGFEEIETLTVVDVLRRAGVKVDLVSVVGSTVTGAYGVKIMTDCRLFDVDADNYDAIILTGGSGYANYSRSAKLMDILKRMSAQGKFIAAICGSPSILAKAGVLDGKRATIYPGMEKELPYPRADKVVVDGKVITSQAAGTAMEFALRLVEAMVGREKAHQIRKDLVV